MPFLNNILDRIKGGTPVSDKISRIKSGDTQLKDQFISDYKPFILKTVSAAVGFKYIEVENSEEYSVGLLAFNEAIDKFILDKNSNFFSFAEQVIRRRIIDYIRSNQKTRNTLPFTYFENDENNHFEEKYLKKDGMDEYENIETEEEIDVFKGRLKEFGITLEDLVECAPKHKDSKQICIVIARTLADTPELYERLIRKKTIPMVDLMKNTSFSSKTIERNRKYIIAITLILRSSLSILQGYIQSTEKGGK